MRNGWIWALVGLVVLVALGWWWYTATAPAAPEDFGQEEVQGESFGDDPKTPAAPVTVRYTAEGFVPALVKVPVGTLVTFVNDTDAEMWIASDEHPSHTGYSGTNKDEHCPDIANVSFDQCAPGASFSFRFAKAGSWSYHNHREDEDRGTVIVTE